MTIQDVLLDLLLTLNGPIKTYYTKGEFMQEKESSAIKLRQAIKQLQNGEPITNKLVEDSEDAKSTI